jgi:hypothetical protein
MFRVGGWLGKECAALKGHRDVAFEHSSEALIRLFHLLACSYKRSYGAA